MKIEATVLESAGVRLEPLGERHREALAAAICDGELWTIRETLVPHPDQLGEFLATAAESFGAGSALAFATIDKLSQRVVGSTRFMNIQAADRRVEIGFTFLRRSAQRTHVNTHCKYLMLRHAFEVWGCQRVELLTDVLNARSRAAITRLGARQEGVLRSHMLMRNGRVRDSVIFSIVSSEWPGLQRRLEALVHGGGAAATLAGTRVSRPPE
jgi:N-acetyltransferase